MIRDCQQFDLRIQDLLDRRIDPETDDRLCAHSAICRECHQSLMAYSLLHTEFLNDSDSMKIKLESLGLQNIVIGYRQKRDYRRMATFIASLAAMLLLAITFCFNNVGIREMEESLAMRFETDLETQGNPVDNTDLEALVQIGTSLNRYNLYNYSTELPPIRSIKALSMCFDWLQRSWHRGATTSHTDPDVSRHRPQSDLRWVEMVSLA